MLGLGAPFGLNLCIAVDGHTTIEAAHAARDCSSEVRRHHPEIEGHDAHEAAHHPCKDVNLLELSVYTDASRSQLNPPPVTPVILARTEANTLSSNGASWMEAERPPADVLGRALRSVVLLI